VAFPTRGSHKPRDTVWNQCSVTTPQHCCDSLWFYNPGGEPIEIDPCSFGSRKRAYRPPPNFAKETDTRFAGYVDQFGEQCRELDALSPTVIAALIRVEIEAMIDTAAWQKRETAERRNRALLGREQAIANWKAEKMQ
jgi:hypothetical protein